MTQISRKTAIVCQYQECYRLTRRWNNLCVRHRNYEPLIKLHTCKIIAFQQWKELIHKKTPSNEDAFFTEYNPFRLYSERMGNDIIR